MTHLMAVSFGEVLGDVASKIFPSIPALLTQLAATAILVFVIRKYLWKNAVDYIEKRKQYLHQVVNETEALKAQAEAQKAKTEQELNSAYLNARTILDEAKQKANAEKEAILNAANQEAEFKRDQIKRELENERAKAEKEMKQQIIDVALTAAEKVIKRQIKDQDSEKLVEEFIKGK